MVAALVPVLGRGGLPICQLPEPRGVRWGEALTAEKMKECRWLRPVPIGQFEFVEWTPDGHLRHPRYTALREDKKPPDVIRDATTLGE